MRHVFVLWTLCMAALLVCHATASVGVVQAAGGCSSRQTSPCCNIDASFSLTELLAFYHAETGLSICRQAVTLGNEPCPVCGVSTPDSARAAKNQASLDTFAAFFDANHCWGAEIGRTPTSNLFALDTRDGTASDMACASCSAASLPGAKVTPCGSTKPTDGGGDGFRLELWMIIAGGAAVVLAAVGLFVFCRRRRQRASEPALPLQYRPLPEQVTQRLN